MKIKKAVEPGWYTSRSMEIIRYKVAKLFNKILVEGKIPDRGGRVMWYQYLRVKEMYRSVGIIGG